MTIINQPDEPTSLKYTNMNKLLFNEGGQPFYLDDLDFMQSAFAETVKGVISTYGNVILSGCEISPPISIAGRPTVYNWDEGYIAINGEVYRVDSGSFSGEMNAKLYWKVVSTEGQKEIYENTSENNVYQYRKVELTDTVAASDIYVSASTMKSMNDFLMTYEEIDIRTAASNVPDDSVSVSFKLFKSNQGFDIVKINFRALKALSGTYSPWVYYDYYEADNKPKIIVRSDTNNQIYTFMLSRGAVLVYPIGGAAMTEFPEGFSYEVVFLLKK